MLKKQSENSFFDGLKLFVDDQINLRKDKFQATFVGKFEEYYLQKIDKVAYTKKVDGGNILIDYDSSGKMLGIEILSEVEVEYYSDYKKREEDESTPDEEGMK